MTHDELEPLLRAARADAFAPGFADRVLRRVGERQDVSTVLARQFVRLVPAVLAASLALAATNWWHARDSAASPLAGAIGLPGATVAAALTLDGPQP